MITKLARTNLYLLRSNGSYKSNGLNCKCFYFRELNFTIYDLWYFN